MKVLPAVLLAALLCPGLAALAPPGASADTYVKSESHVDSYYRGGQVIPEENSVQDIWIGDQRLAYVTDGQKIVVDLNQNSLMFVNRTDSTFVETTLPLDLSQVFSPEENARLELFKRRGTVAVDDTPKEIGSWTCRGYNLNDWMIYDDSKLNERDIVMWTTTDVPFDCAVVREMLTSLEILANLSPDYIALRGAIEGFQVGAEETMYTEGIAIKTTISVTEFTETEPPEDLYTAPEGFEKKDLLTLQDLNS